MAPLKSPYVEDMTSGNLQWSPRPSPQASSQPEVAMHQAPEVTDTPPEEPAWLIVAPGHGSSQGTGSIQDDTKYDAAWKEALTAGDAGSTNRTRSRRWLCMGIIAGVLAALVTGGIAGAVIGTRNRNAPAGAAAGNGSSVDDGSGSNGGGRSGGGSAGSHDGSHNGTVEVTPRSEAVAMNTTFAATFVTYGNGSCSSPRNACGFTTEPGFSAAVSQNLFGVAPFVVGTGATGPPGPRPGPECDTCWSLHATLSKDGVKMDKTIVVKVNNICAARDERVCAQKDLNDTNPNGGQVTFSLCIDSGATEALLLPGSDAAIGEAVKVDCSVWTGRVVKAQGGPPFGRPTGRPTG